MKKIVSMMSTVMIFLSFLILFGINVSAETSYTFSTVNNGKVSSYSSDYDLTVTVFGSPTCSNTKSVLKALVDLEIGERDDVCVNFVDCKKNTKSYVKDFAEAYDGTGINFCYDTGSNASSAMWYYVHLAGLGNQIYYPATVFIEGDGTVRSVTTGYQKPESIEAIVNGGEVVEENTEFTVTGEDNYDNAYEVLSLLNELRQSLGLNKLKMDKELLDAAMQRAAELSVYYSHTRPNDTSCFSITDDDYSHAENIAIGHTSATAVMEGWTGSSGHYANMTYSSYKSVGIGCFEASDGTLCWVQYFSSKSPTKITKSGSVATSHTIYALYKNLDIRFSIDGNLSHATAGEKYSFKITNLNVTFPYVSQEIDSSSFEFASSDSDIISISDNGVCNVKDTGEVKLTATLKSNSTVSFDYEVNVGHVHTYSSYTYKTKPTCTKNGVKTKTCTECGHVVSKTVKATGHKSDGGKVTLNATYTATGTMTYTCTNCDKVISTETIAKLTLGKVEKLKASSVKKTSIKLTWSGVDGAKKYRVYQYIDGKWKKIKTTSKTSYTVEELKSGTKYKFKVRAIINSDIKGSYSSVLETQTKLNTPSVTLKSGSEKAIVSWKEVTGASGYEIVYSTSSKMTNTKKTTVKKGSTVKKTIKKLKKGKKYYFKVRAYTIVNGEKVYSSWSGVKSISVK